jgi:hypothetical protein
MLRIIHHCQNPSQFREETQHVTDFKVVYHLVRRQVFTMFKLTLVYLGEMLQTDEMANPRENKLYAYRNSNPGR